MSGSYLPEGSQVAGTPLERSNVFRRQGNDLYRKAREVARGADPYTNLRGVQESVKLFQAAMVEYGKALHFLPNDHRLLGNRALCYQAVEDWVKCREDAQRCVRLRPEYAKGWLLLVKATWELGQHSEAMQELQNGLRAIPSCRDLVDLQAGLTSGHQARSLGRSVSPACTPGHTPPVSRANTPSRSITPPPGHPAATLPAISLAGAATSRSPGGSRPSSRSPGASGRMPAPPRPPPAGLEGSLTCGTGNFGVPTPSFANGPAGAVAVAEASLHSAFTLQATGGASATGTLAGSTGPRRVNSPGPAIADRGAPPAEGGAAEGGGDNHSPSRKVASSLKSLSESGRR